MLVLALLLSLAAPQAQAAQGSVQTPSIDLATLLVALIGKHRMPALGGAVVTEIGRAHV